MASATHHSQLNCVITTLKEATQNSTIPSLSESAASALETLDIAQGLKYNQKAYRLAEDACGLVYGVVCTVSTDSVYLQFLRELAHLLSKLKGYLQEEASRIKIVARLLTNPDTISFLYEKLSRFMWIFGLKTDDNYLEDATWTDLVMAEVPKKQKKRQLVRQHAERMATVQAVQPPPEYTKSQTDPRTSATGGKDPLDLSKQPNHGISPASSSDQFTFVGGNCDRYMNSVANTNSGNIATNTTSDSYNDSSVHVKGFYM